MRTTFGLVVLLPCCVACTSQEKGEKTEATAKAGPAAAPAPPRGATIAAPEADESAKTMGEARDRDAANVYAPEEKEIASRGRAPSSGVTAEEQGGAVAGADKSEIGGMAATRARRESEALSGELAEPRGGAAPAPPPPAAPKPAPQPAATPAKKAKDFAEVPLDATRAADDSDDRPRASVKPGSHALEIAAGGETAGNIGTGQGYGGIGGTGAGGGGEAVIGKGGGAGSGIGTAMGPRLSSPDVAAGTSYWQYQQMARRPRPSYADKPYRPLPPPTASWPRDARYRSNYLPGRGYLDHLLASLEDRTLGRADWAAIQPAVAARDALPMPRDRALDMAVDQLHDLLPPSGGETTLRVRLRAAAAPPRPAGSPARPGASPVDVLLAGGRAPLYLHLVLDKSGSMSGAPWRAVCAAVRDVAARLDSRDLLSVTTYDTRGRLLSPPVPGGRSADAAAARVCATRPSGDTNIYEGLMSGYEQARATYHPSAVNRVILLSDGVATAGPRDLYTVTLGTVEALGQGVTTSAVGVGDEFDALLMGRVAREGAGNYHYVRDHRAVPAIFTDELAVLAQEAAQAVEVRVQLNPAVDLLEVVGSEPLTLPESLRTRQVELATDARLAEEKGISADRATDFEGGVRFLIPSFRAGDEHTFVLRVRVPAGNGSRVLARVKLRYKDVLFGRNEKLRADRWAAYAATDAEAAASRRGDVAVGEARARARVALERGSEYMDRRNIPGIRRELYAAAQALTEAAGMTGDTTVAAEAARVRRMADVAGLAERKEHYHYLASLYHYGMCSSGQTIWALR